MIEFKELLTKEDVVELSKDCGFCELYSQYTNEWKTIKILQIINFEGHTFFYCIDINKKCFITISESDIENGSVRSNKSIKQYLI